MTFVLKQRLSLTRIGCAWALFVVTLIGGAALAGETVYVYDETGRLKATGYPTAIAEKYKLDPAGNRTQVTTVQTTPPSVPTGLTSVSSAQQIVLSWSASTPGAESTVAGYKVFRGGTLLAETTGPATTYTDTCLSPSTTYSYQVAAYNEFRGTSALSAVADSTCQRPGDLDSIRDQLDVDGVDRPLRLRGRQLPCVPRWKSSGHSGSDELSRHRLAPNTTYRYTVTAADNASNVSVASAAASATRSRPRM